MLGGAAMYGSFRNVRETTSPQGDVIKSDLTAFLVGPHIDWYFDPGAGLHAQVTFGLARFDDGEDNANSSGYGVAAGRQHRRVLRLALGRYRLMADGVEVPE